jgi:hypothetical protein
MELKLSLWNNTPKENFSSFFGFSEASGLAGPWKKLNNRKN